MSKYNATEDMIQAAHKIAQSKPGHAYNAAELERLVREGLFELPVNEPIISVGDQYLIYTGPEVICYKRMAGGSSVETRRTKADDGAVEALIIQYAVAKSQLRTRVGG